MKLEGVRSLTVCVLAGILLAGNALLVGAASPVNVIVSSDGRSISMSDDAFFTAENVQPGIQLDQTIYLYNSYSRPTSLYLIASDAAEYEPTAGADDLIEHLRITLYASNGNILYSGPMSGRPNSVDDTEYNMRSSIFLGSLNGRSSDYIYLTLEIPQDLDNAYQDSLAKINWAIHSIDHAQPGGNGDSGSSGTTIADQIMPLALPFIIEEEQVPLTPLPKTGGTDLLTIVIVVGVAGAFLLGKALYLRIKTPNL